MKLSKLILILIITFIGTATVSADNRQSRKHIRKGNTLFRSDKRKEALVDYVKAVRADTTNARALYNLSTSMFPAAWRNVQENQRDTMINYFKAAAQQETNSYRKATSSSIPKDVQHSEQTTRQKVEDSSPKARSLCWLTVTQPQRQRLYREPFKTTIGALSLAEGPLVKDSYNAPSTCLTAP